MTDGGAPVACSFEVRLDESWRTEAVSVSAASAEVTRIKARADAERRWWVGAERHDHPTGVMTESRGRGETESGLFDIACGRA
ncbi:MAG: putative glycolipid-binding domain-containing protein [Kineosporiaceae bacterium]